MIIDFRVCPPFRSLAQTMVFDPVPEPVDPVTQNGLQMDQVPCASRTERSMGAFLDEMDAAGIDLAVVTGRFAPRPRHTIDNDDVVELIQRWPERFRGLGAVDAHSTDAVREIHRLTAAGLSGFSFSNGWNHLPDDADVLMPVYAACADLGVVVALTNSFFIGADLHYSSPVHLQRVAGRFPELTIVAAHGNYPWTAQSVAVAWSCPNVYLMPDLYLNRPFAGREDYITALNGVLGAKFLHGSSYPVRSMGESLACASALGFVDDSRRRAFLGGNAARLLGFPGEAA